MPEKKLNSTFVELATNLLDKDKIDYFLDFINFTKNNELSLNKKSTYSCYVSYKKNRLCALNLYTVKGYKPDGSWGIVPLGGFFEKYDKHINDTELQELILNSLNFILCPNCKGDGCANWEKRQYCTTIFGKSFSNICSGYPIKFMNPCDESLECVKKIIILTKSISVDKIDI